MMFFYLDLQIDLLSLVSKTVESMGAVPRRPMGRVDGLLLERTQVLTLPISRVVLPLVLSCPSITVST